MVNWKAAFILLWLGPSYLGGQTKLEQKEALAQSVEEPPVLDGILDDPAWSRATKQETFIQRDPLEGQPSSETTSVRFLYADDALYIGFQCFDSDPSRIVATERRRDQDLTKDDSVAVLLDTFLDRRNAFIFRINALGTQFDALVTEEGRDINTSWDEAWTSAASINETGWSAEIMIPFKSLRMRQGGSMVWGLEIERLIRRKNESVYWNNWNRDFKFEDVSRAGLLSGIENVDTGLRLRIKPFVLGGFEQIPGPDGGTNIDNRSEAGLEVLKYRPTRSLTLDLTINTDFAQTEVDDLVPNITRFPLFFPEKREFFLEGSGVFDFGTGLGFQGRDFTLFHSRRIGLSPSRELIPILGGAKLTGRIGDYTIGLIDAQTDSILSLDPQGNPVVFSSTNSGVVRVKRDLFERSSVGAIFTNRQSSQDQDYNRTYGADANFVFARNLNLFGFVAKSDTPGLSQDDWSAFGRVNWDSDFLLATGEYLLVQRNFNPELGFVPRRDQRKTALQFGIRPRPESKQIRQFLLRTRMDYTQNQEGKQESMNFHYLTFETFFQSGDVFTVDLHRNFERLFKPFQIHPDITVPIGSYRSWDIRLAAGLAPHRRISGRNLVNFEYEWGFFGGTLLELQLRPQLKINDSLSIDILYDLNDVNLPFGDFLVSVVNTRVNYAFSNRWLTSTTIQHSNLDHLLNYRFRLNFIYRPGDDFFFIYNEGRSVGLQLRPEETNLLGRAVMVKFTHSFDF